MFSGMWTSHESQSKIHEFLADDSLQLNVAVNVVQLRKLLTAEVLGRP